MSRPAPTVACPTCGRPSAYTPANRWRPFCSQRCKSIDLGAWAAERYRIAGQPLDDEPGADERATGERATGERATGERETDERAKDEGRARRTPR